MAAQVSSRDAFCTFTFFDCFSNKEDGNLPIDQRPRHSQCHLRSVFDHELTTAGVFIKRETTVLEQQPHLIEPMKLTVYEDLPCTPLSAHHDIATPRPFFSRAVTASRASSRASLFSLKKIVTRNSLSISVSTSAPTVDAQVQSDLPSRKRRRDFRPLELSIYVDSKRLSDLPEFNRFSFTEFGELKDPCHDLSRPQSALLPPCRETDSNDIDNDYKPTSVYEIGSSKTSRPQTSYSVISMSRPPSEYDALHSHPVSWSTLPGLSIPNQHSKQDKRMTVLTPMEEETSSEPAAVSVGETILKFPQRQSSFFSAGDSQATLADLAAPAPVVRRIAHHGCSLSRSLDDVNFSLNKSRHMHKRSISQWLASRARSRSTSASTISSTSTTRSFVEHHRKRSQFYQLGNHISVPATTISLTRQPQQLSEIENLPRNGSLDFVENTTRKNEHANTNQHEHQYQSQSQDQNEHELDNSDNQDDYHHHQRTVTDSSLASTIDTDILSDSTYSTTRTISSNGDERCLRSNTIRSVSSPGGRKPITAVVSESGLATPMRGQVYIINDDDYDEYEDHNDGVIDSEGNSLVAGNNNNTLKKFGIGITHEHIDGISNINDGAIRGPTVGVAF